MKKKLLKNNIVIYQAKSGALDPKAVLELIKEFASTWVSLDAHDKETLAPFGTTKKAITLSAVELTEAIANLKIELQKKGEATELFAQERQI